MVFLNPFAQDRTNKTMSMCIPPAVSQPTNTCRSADNHRHVSLPHACVRKLIWKPSCEAILKVSTGRYLMVYWPLLLMVLLQFWWGCFLVEFCLNLYCLPAGRGPSGSDLATFPACWHVKVVRTESSGPDNSPLDDLSITFAGWSSNLTKGGICKEIRRTPKGRWQKIGALWLDG